MISHIGIKDTAKMLGMDEQTVRDMEGSGKLLPAYKTTGGHRRYRVSDIETIQNTGDYPEILYNVRYINYDILPDKIMVPGMVVQYGDNGQAPYGVVDMSDNTLTDEMSCSFHELGTYVKSDACGVKISKLSYECPIVFKSDKEFGAAGIGPSGVSPIEKNYTNWAELKKQDDETCYLQFNHRSLYHYKDVPIKYDNLWTKIPRVMIGLEARLNRNTIQIVKVFYNRISIM